jgi:xanthine dehydrogenase/oxidase
MLATEVIVEHVAAHLKLDPLFIRRLNLYKEGDLTYYGQSLDLWNVPRILDELTNSSGFVQRQKSVENFNLANNYRKRGLTMVPTKFSIALCPTHLNQAGALVHIYRDGSVLLTHGGILLFCCFCQWNFLKIFC